MAKRTKITSQATIIRCIQEFQARISNCKEGIGPIVGVDKNGWAKQTDVDYHEARIKEYKQHIKNLRKILLTFGDDGE